MPLIRCFGRGIRVPDLDQLFCYETVKLVNVLDWKPGVVYRAGIIFTCLYCFGFALVINQMYLEHMQAFGSVMITASGDAWSQPRISTEQEEGNDSNSNGGRRLLSVAPTAAPTDVPLPKYRYWDVFDTVDPDSESGGVVLATRKITTRRQTMQPCPNKVTKCPGDCKTDPPIHPNLCYPKTDYCMEYNWCPLFGQAGPQSTEDLIEGIDEFNLDFMATMAFDRRNPDQVTVKHHQMSVADLLSEVDTDYKAIQKTGIIIYAKLQWGTDKEPCTVDGSCDLTFRAVRMDTEEPGFKFRQSTYYRGNGTLPKEYRDVSKTFGIRVLASSSGYATAFSLVEAMLQFSSAFAMFALSYFVADIFVVWLNFRRSKYIELTIEETPDLNKLKEAQEAAKIDAQTNKKSRRPRINHARQRKVEEEDEEED